MNNMTDTHQIHPITPEPESSKEIHPDELALAQLISDIFVERQEGDGLSVKLSGTRIRKERIE